MADLSEGYVQCSFCQQNINKANILMHEGFCRRNIIKCEICAAPIDKFEKKMKFFPKYHVSLNIIINFLFGWLNL